MAHARAATTNQFVNLIVVREKENGHSTLRAQPKIRLSDFSQL